MHPPPPPVDGDGSAERRGRHVPCAGLQVSDLEERDIMRNATKTARETLQGMAFNIDGQLFTYASMLFVQRVRVAEKALGGQLLCGASAAPAVWPHTSVLDRW